MTDIPPRKPTASDVEVFRAHQMQVEGLSGEEADAVVETVLEFNRLAAERAVTNIIVTAEGLITLRELSRALASLQAAKPPKAGWMDWCLPAAVARDAAANLEEVYAFGCTRGSERRARRLFYYHSVWIVIGHWGDVALSNLGKLRSMIGG